MPRWHRSTEVLEAAEAWKQRCLLADGSVFTERSLWNLETLGYLDTYFVKNLDEGEGSFWRKLEAQLGPAPAQTNQLAAEMFWVMYLFVSDTAMKAGTKRLQIRRIWEWSGEPLPAAEFELGPALEHGVGHPGTAYSTHRWREFLFFIELMREWKGRGDSERRKLIADPWEFAAWMDARKVSSGRQLRHILLYLLFPDHFERSATGIHKRQIVRRFRERFGEDPGAVDYGNHLEVDREIFRIRAQLADEFGTGELDFYREPLEALWREPETGEVRPVSEESDELRTWYAATFGEARVWAIGAGDGARLWPEFRRERIVAIGWDSIGDLGEYKSREEISAAMKMHLGPEANPVMDSLASWQFAHEMAPGDHVIVKRGRSELLGHGVVMSEYRFDPNRSEYQNVRTVDWRATGSWPLPEGRRIATKTLTDFTPYKEWLRFASNLMYGSGPERDAGQPPASDPEPYTVADAVKGLFLTPHQFGRILDALGRKKNLILEGPPGVGKTFIAKRIAWSLMGYRDPHRVEMVQFHQSYSYEDFIQGWRPTGSGGFDRQDGVFIRFCSTAKDDPEHTYVFIIDEINRGNLSRIFGELMLLLEVDKRGADFAIPLTYARSDEERFCIPDNVYILGMMNTADRSLAMVDYALRRRFAFVRLEPAFGSEQFSDHMLEAGISEELLSRIINRFTELNDEIRRDRSLGPGFEIGHSYFVPQNGDDRIDESWYETVIRSEIEPLLSEYWFDQPSKVEQAVDKLLR